MYGKFLTYNLPVCKYYNTELLSTEIAELLWATMTSLLSMFSNKFYFNPTFRRCRHGHDHMVVGFTTTYAISAYHH